MDVDRFQAYLDERYTEQIGWYSDKASRNKGLYYSFQWTAIVLSATLPVLIAILSPSWEWIALVTSVALAIATAGLKTFKFQENWINYRTIAETLKKEHHYLDAGLGDYSDAEDPQALFVERVEALISRENTLWIMTQTKEEEKEPE